MEVGSVIKVAFPQGDGKIKFRPAIALAKIPPFNDWTVCGVSSKINLEVNGLDILIHKKHPDFKLWGLPYPGIIRAGFIATIPENIINGTIGNISKETCKNLLENISEYLLNNKF